MTARRPAQADTGRRDIAPPWDRSTPCCPAASWCHVRCGKANCACVADPPRLHGPYIQWTRTVAGKTVTKLLTQEQLDRYQPWFDNARRVRELLAQLEAASLSAMAAAEGWGQPD